MKILLTGAEGFIGSHLTEKLVSLGFNVKAFVLYNSFNSLGWLDYCDPKIINNLEIFTGDIRDSFGVKEAMKDCDIVIHLAALIAIPYSYYSPETYIDTNIKGTLNLLQASREKEIEKFIHTSTSEVYGTAKYVPIDENHPLQAQSPYSASKIGADNIVSSFNASFQLPTVIVRPFNTYGPRQSARAVIPTIITQILDGSRNIKLGSTSPTRDFNYILDTVNAFISVLRSSDGIGDTFNFGSNYEISILETVKLISKLMNCNIKVVSDEIRKRPIDSEVERLNADYSKAHSTFNWSPKYSGLNGFKVGLQETINWFSNKENLKKYKPNDYNI